MAPIIVTLTTIPSRVGLLWPVLDSLLHNQTTRPAMVVVNLPRVYADGLGQVEAPPAEWKARGPVPLVVNRDCDDLGPGTKLVGAAAILARHPGAIALYLDDDHVPNRYLVQAHAIAHARAAQPTVWCGRGEVVRSTAPFRRRIVSQRDPTAPVHIPSGVGSVSVPVAHLHLGALVGHVARGSSLARMADDLVFADWYARRGLPVRTLGQDHLLQVQPHATDAWALHLSQRADCATEPDQRYAAVAAELGARFAPLRPQAARAGRSRVKIWKGQQTKA